MARRDDHSKDEKNARRGRRTKKWIQNKNFWKRFPAFLFETAYEILTWVFIMLSGGSFFYFMSRDNGRGALWSAVTLLLLVIVLIALVFDRHYFQSEEKSPDDKDRFQISVVSEVWFHELRRNAALSYSFVYQYGDRVIRSPIHDMIYVRLTNTGRLPFMIDYLGVEISNDGKKWTPAFLLDVFSNPVDGVAITPPETIRPKLSVPSKGGNLKDALQYEPAKPRLRDVVMDKNIGPKETVKGWLFIERPDGFDAKGGYRLKVRNLNGDEAVGAISQMKHIENGFAGTDFVVVANHVDLTKIPICYYSERDKSTDRK